MNAHVKSFDDVSVMVLAPVARFNLRIAPADLDAASTAFGITLPGKVGQGAAKGERAAYCLGPDEWLLEAPSSEAETFGRIAVGEAAHVARHFALGAVHMEDRMREIVRRSEQFRRQTRIGIGFVVGEMRTTEGTPDRLESVGSRALIDGDADAVLAHFA